MCQSLFLICINCLSTWQKRLISPIILTVTVIVWVAGYGYRRYAHLTQKQKVHIHHTQIQEDLTHIHTGRSDTHPYIMI